MNTIMFSSETRKAGNGDIFMSEDKKEIVEKIANAFPKLDAEQQFMIAGYIAGAENELARRNKLEKEKESHTIKDMQ